MIVMECFLQTSAILLAIKARSSLKNGMGRPAAHYR